MKKLCFILPHSNSAIWFVWNQMQALSKDYEVHLITSFVSEDSISSFPNIVCHNVDIYRRINLFKDFFTLIELIKIYRKESFDSIHSISTKCGLLSAIAGRFCRIHVRIHSFTGQVWATQKGIKRVIFKSIDKLITRLNTNLLADGFAQARFLKIQGVSKEKEIQVLANGSITGVDLVKFTPSIKIRERERRKFKLSDDKVAFVFLGRLKEEKGVKELLYAFNLLVADSPNAVLILYGDDEENFNARVSHFPNIHIGKNYFYGGYTSAPFESIQVGDVFCLPSYREGFGSSVIEASCLGMPVIVSDVYGLDDAVVDGVTGLRCHVKNYDSLYSCMKSYCFDSAMRQNHGKAGRNYVIEKFDSKIVTQAWVDFYNSVTSLI